jgi:hypothetical protein
VLCVSQTNGVATTAFTVRGSGFAPGSRVQLTVTFYTPPPPQESLVGTVTMLAKGPHGTFSYVIGGGRGLDPGPLDNGLFRVVASGTDGRGAETYFRTIPDDAP